MKLAFFLDWHKNLPFWILTGFLISVFLMGGSSRSDVASLAILRPVSVLTCGIAMCTLQRDHFAKHRFLLCMAAAIFMLVGSHLVPLPPALWSMLPGREPLVAADDMLGLHDVWRPISMAPIATWNAFFALFAPLAVLLLGIQLSREQQFQLLPVLLFLGLFGGLLGLLQVAGAPKGQLYFYDTTNSGSAVGLFANRNHQALLLTMLFPMLAAFASTGIRSAGRATNKDWLAVACGLVIVPLLLVTGSRAGLIIGIFALGLAAAVYRQPQSRKSTKSKISLFNPRMTTAAVGVLISSVLTIAMSRAEAFERLFDPADLAGDRFRFWPTIANMAVKYFPVGSGPGTFAEVYRMDEPHDLLTMQYLNQAHNDWLHIFLTTGFLGLLLLAIAVAAVSFALVSIWRSRGWQSRGRTFAILGAALLLLAAMGSIGDYPLHTPIFSCLFAVAALWLSGIRENGRKLAKNSSKSVGNVGESQLAAHQ